MWTVVQRRDSYGRGWEKRVGGVEVSGAELSVDGGIGSRGGPCE